MAGKIEMVVLLDGINLCKWNKNKYMGLNE